MDIASLPRSIYSGAYNTGHCQGIAIDRERKYLYYSFTTALVKTDLSGRVVGWVKGLLGHLGCICFNDADGRVYGSLEYKNDAIGKGILGRLGEDAVENAFYAAIFDVERIDRPDMDAASDGIMTVSYLREVVQDYEAEVCVDGQTLPHRHGCSGIDGTTIAPRPNGSDIRDLYVAYGVYSDVNRTDNDNQVILRYSLEEIAATAAPIDQRHMHRNGPAAPLEKLLVPTGNTTYGIQNLEYDPFTGKFLAAVYPGRKPAYPNDPFFVIDPARTPVSGTGDAFPVSAWNTFQGFPFRYGDTGMIALGEGYYYFSHHGRTAEGLWDTTVRLYRWDGVHPFVPVE